MWIFAAARPTGDIVLYYEPEAVAKHTGAHSISNLTLEMRRIYWYRSLLRYSARHFRPIAFRAVCLAVAVGSVPRMIGDVILVHRPQLLTAYVEVVRLAGRAWFSAGGTESVVTGPSVVAGLS